MTTVAIEPGTYISVVLQRGPAGIAHQGGRSADLSSLKPSARADPPPSGPMIDVPDIPVTSVSRERGRLQAPGRRTDTNSYCTLLVIHEEDGSWAIHGLAHRGRSLR